MADGREGSKERPVANLKRPSTGGLLTENRLVMVYFNPRHVNVQANYTQKDNANTITSQ